MLVEDGEVGVRGIWGGGEVSTVSREVVVVTE